MRFDNIRFGDETSSTIANNLLFRCGVSRHVYPSEAEIGAGPIARSAARDTSHDEMTDRPNVEACVNRYCASAPAASPVHEGEERPDAWPLDEELRDIGRRFGIEADRDLVSS